MTMHRLAICDYPVLIVTRKTLMKMKMIFRIQRSWFLKDGESGLHSFLRLAYYNDTDTNLGPIGEIRSMFRPTYPGAPWTDIITNNAQWV
jgi:hypothetical protein